jgi:hypothetical protein
VSTGPIEDEYHRDSLRDATRILAIIDGKIDGESAGDLSLYDLGWLRAMLLDSIETHEIALGLDHSQTRESVHRTIRLGMDAGNDTSA